MTEHLDTTTGMRPAHWTDKGFEFTGQTFQYERVSVAADKVRELKIVEAVFGESGELPDKMDPNRVEFSVNARYIEFPDHALGPVHKFHVSDPISGVEKSFGIHSPTYLAEDGVVDNTASIDTTATETIVDEDGEETITKIQKLNLRQSSFLLSLVEKSQDSGRVEGA